MRLISILLLLGVSVVADVDERLYYKQSTNILRDVAANKYSSMYIQYHGCVWSEYTGGGDDHDDENGCGGDGGEYYWYMGNVPCFRANVAFSLYGVKKGKKDKNPCNRGNYINSFFTTGGIESFGDSVGLNYYNYGASSQCYNSDGNDDGDQEQQDDYYVKHGQLIYSNSESKVLGCSAGGDFVNAVFKGAYCDGNNYKSSSGLTSLNTDLNKKYKCMLVHSYGNSQVENLLSNSVVCSAAIYGNKCPDPYGKQRKQQKKYEKAIIHYRRAPLGLNIISALMFCFALFLFGMFLKM